MHFHSRNNLTLWFARATGFWVLIFWFSAHSLALGAQSTPNASALTKPWSKMKKAERKEYMKHVVLPKMKELMQAFDERRFAEVKCATCHGAGDKNGTYKMPNPKLPKLPSTPDGWKELKDKFGDIYAFMQTKMKPTMAELLGEKPSGPGNPKGFGCSDCHTSKK